MADEPKEWLSAAEVVRAYGIGGASELGRRGLLEWRGPVTEAKLEATDFGWPFLGVSCPGSEARCLPAQRAVTPPDETSAETSAAPLTFAELEEMRRRVEAASPGPWGAEYAGAFRDEGMEWVVLTGPILNPTELEYWAKADGEFAAAARTDVVRLLDEVERCHGLLREAEKKAHPLMTVDFATGAIIPAPVEEPLTLVQRAVLEAAKEWERSDPYTRAEEAAGERLDLAVRALREAALKPLRIDIGKLTEAHRQEFIRALKAHVAADLPMPEDAGVPFPVQAPIVMVRVDPALPPGTVRLEASDDGPSVTVTNLAVDPLVQTSAPTQEKPATLPIINTYSHGLETALAEALFIAYNEQGPNPWKTWDGKDVPRWPALSAQVVEKWRAVARAALAEQERVGVR